MTTENPFGEVIFSYSRTQAINDGMLADLSHVDSIRQHWKHPFACTSAVWAIIEEALQKEGQDVSGICRDISTMAKLAIRETREAELIFFAVISSFVPALEGAESRRLVSRVWFATEKTA